MIEATTRFQTQNAQKYLEQMSKHFAHKVEVKQSGANAEYRFACGNAVLEADSHALRIKVEAPGDTEFGETKAVIEDHLLRFAFREKPAPLVWEPGQA